MVGRAPVVRPCAGCVDCTPAPGSGIGASGALPAVTAPPHRHEYTVLGPPGTAVEAHDDEGAGT
ncbi:hypothetical protein [Saccharothrix obliqua]|uniref:hypothetical protein n=1 Tax=Saccharothrix obliqua TaxID=2861747 RepID=UPI001C5EAD64|nr:hypothetical protein [Saccharothrix obliqua]MBW4722296.1 hypothetical protein [Saccharothrix obliqua]